MQEMHRKRKKIELATKNEQGNEKKRKKEMKFELKEEMRIRVWFQSKKGTSGRYHYGNIKELKLDNICTINFDRQNYLEDVKLDPSNMTTDKDNADRWNIVE